jgi:hypothetical protein
MPWRSPEFEGDYPSLGWQLIDLWADLFPSPRDEGAPFILTDSQAWNVIGWYQIHPFTGEFVHRRGCSRRSKGSGKSPIEGAKCISELALPVRFDGWDAKGEPVARPWGTMGDPAPWVQIASLSEDQDENTYSPLYYFLTANDGRLADELKIDAGLTRCFLRDRSDARIEPVTSRAGSREGQPVTYATLDESGLMTRENGGLRLARTIRRNTAKMGGRSYETTNGFMPGENSVAEGTHKSVESGTVGIFYDAVEAPTSIDGVEVCEDASDEILRAALKVAYGDAWWVDLDRLVADTRDPDMPWPDAERFFFNWNRKGERQALDIKKWEALRLDYELEAGAPVGLGFDGSISQDSTVLYGFTQSGYGFLVAAWERPPGAAPDWQVPRLQVHAAVHEAFERWNVGLMLCDPAKWWTEILQWVELWSEDRVLAFDTNSAVRFAPACDRFVTAVEGAAITHDGSPLVTKHLSNMARKTVRVNVDESDGRTRFVFVKSGTGKIDAGIAATLALEAAMTMIVPADGRMEVRLV